jgi:LysR family transcriptional regulator, nitrogen assimilation regulatory protein
MDLRRLRTFVAIADLGTVSKAALHLRISQSALSRQISDLEQEFRVRLFDRVGRRLVLTAIGEELLADCRSVLGQVGSLGERVQLLRGGDHGVLKVAASPQMIESVLSTFLPRYAARFPNVQVKLTEALGPAQVALLERGEVHLGIRHDQGIHPSLANHPLLPDEVLAACDPSLDIGPAEMIDIGRLASHPLLLLEPGYSVRVQFNAACRLANVKPNMLFESRAPHTLLALAEAGHGVAIIPSHLRDGSLRAENLARSASGQTASGGIGHPVGQSAPDLALCRKLSRGARRVHARGLSDHAAVESQDGHTQTTCYPNGASTIRSRSRNAWKEASHSERL